MQGRSPSPILFNGYIKKILDEMIKETIYITFEKVQGKKINVFRFADASSLLVDSEDELVEILTEMGHS